MKELSISLVEPSPAMVQNIKTYAQTNQLQIHIENLKWDDALQHLTDYVLYNKGPDIATMGVHWVPHFLQMNALRPFYPATLQTIGHRTRFLPTNWEVGVSGHQVHAIPFATDVRVIYYRRDLLAKVGIDEATAFATVSHMQQTFRRLRTLDNIHPLAVPSQAEWLILHNMAMWIWHAGGRFISEDGRRTLFSHSPALTGIRQHFEVFGAALIPEAFNLNQVECNNLFVTGQAATLVAGPWVLQSFHKKTGAPIVLENLGIAALPITTFVGGQNLVMWKHAHNITEGSKLIQYLVQDQTQFKIFHRENDLPSVTTVLKDPAFMSSQHVQAFLQGIQTGRGFKAQYLWGVVENRLLPALRLLWQHFFEQPQANMEVVATQTLTPIAKTLDHILSRR